MSIVDLKIQFHDRQTIDFKVEVTKCERTLNSQEKSYASLIKNGIRVERIAKEQHYLLSHFPDFCRVYARRINDMPFI
jgi:hypothetical protein